MYRLNIYKGAEREKINRDTDRAVAFHVGLPTLSCHTGDWNYQRHFCQSFEVGEHFSLGSDQNSARTWDFLILQALASLGVNPAACAPAVAQLHPSVTRSGRTHKYDGQGC